jgi:hypothetical protein
MRRADHLLKTMLALRSCLDECRQDATPLAALDKCVKQLRQNPDWTDAEVAEVEAAARRAIESARFGRTPASGPQSTKMVGVHF